MNIMRLLLAVLLIALSSGCQGTAKVMTYDSVSSTGVVWIPENIERHRVVAVELMKNKCPAGYTIVSEGKDAMKAGVKTKEDGYYLTFQCAARAK